MHIEERNRNSNIEMHIEIEYRKIYNKCIIQKYRSNKIKYKFPPDVSMTITSPSRPLQSTLKSWVSTGPSTASGRSWRRTCRSRWGAWPAAWTCAAERRRSSSVTWRRCCSPPSISTCSVRTHWRYREEKKSWEPCMAWWNDVLLLLLLLSWWDVLIVMLHLPVRCINNKTTSPGEMY